MKRIMVIGCSGSGKSTLSFKLQKKLGLEVISLDEHYWNPGWEETPKEEWEKIVLDLIKKPSWIMDGNYGGTMDQRMERADTIIFLDCPTLTCIYRALKRILKYHGKVRPEMSPGCPERFDWPFFHYILMFRTIRRNGILEKLKTAADRITVYVLKNNKEVQSFLDKI